VAKPSKNAAKGGSSVRLIADNSATHPGVSSEQTNPQRTVPTPQIALAVETRRRKTGKRSDPEFRPTTFFVRKQTQRNASRLLEDQDSGKDLSDLVEELLAKWIVEHSNV